MRTWLRGISIAAALLGLTSANAQAQSGLAPGASRIYSTIYSVGVEWDIAGDVNHNASAVVEYRVEGSVTWTNALDLVRVDFNGANMLAGSILFLTPGTGYDVRVALSDPDGGGETRLLSVSTRRLPALSSGGRAFHVIPGSGGGDGSSTNPFKGVTAAQAMAQPGDTMLLHRGSYGGRIRFDKPGTSAAYLAWIAYGDGEVLLNGLDIAASHIWLEGITVRNQAYATFSIAAPDNVVVRRCFFYNNHYSIYLQQGGTNWYIADNTIVGDTAYTTESFDGEGIELNSSGGHTVAFNSITRVADGVSYPLSNVDIFGNDIFDTSDDGIEADFGYANVRMWGNRIHNAAHNAISFQPQNGGPWYIVRNQIVNNMEAAFKFRTTDRFVLLHNTIVNWGNAWPDTSMMCCNEDHVMRAIARNNLWINVQGGPIWGFDGFTKDWRTNLDYDGFDWGTTTNPFQYGGVTYPDLASFSSASLLEQHGIRISRNTCFQSFNVPTPPPSPVPPQVMTLNPSCGAVDAGAVLPNINEGVFSGAAPDMGAYEYGQAAQNYGPRLGPTGQLTAQPSAIPPGQSSWLSWITTNAVSVVIDGMDVPLSGSAIVSPATTATYTLLASGIGGTAIAGATVTVGPAQPALGAPSNLTAQALDRSRISLTWGDNSASEAGFKIERSTNGSSFTEVAAVGANVTTYVDGGLQKGKKYFYRVRAYSGPTNSSYSNTDNATTPKR